MGGERGRRYGALPWYRDEAGGVRVILITTRTTGSWSVPRGRRIPGKTRRRSAEIETYEESGKVARAGRKLGAYLVAPRGGEAGRKGLPLQVTVYAARVRRHVDAWPERGQRLVTDVTPTEAVGMVRDTGLAKIIGAFAESRAKRNRGRRAACVT